MKILKNILILSLIPFFIAFIIIAVILEPIAEAEGFFKGKEP